ncbi:AAA family ATPase [bacterium]|nr:AAA family ATPase [bacterium]
MRNDFSNKRSMMNQEQKGQSPFFPGQPVPVDLFVGRSQEKERIDRASYQVANGKPQAIFITGEYGIGKSSLARFARLAAEENQGVIGFHCMLGGVSTLDDLSLSVVQSIVDSYSTKPSVTKTIRDFLSEYIGEQSLFGVTLRLDKLKKDAPDISRGFLPFLRQIYHRIQKEYKGILLIIDEINGITGNPNFGAFLKGLVDENALSDTPLPLLLMVCGTEERYREIVKNYIPVERIFHIIQIDKMSDEEMRDFFDKAFDKVGMRVDAEAMDLICRNSGGFPRLMHLVGDAAFWIAKNNTINEETAIQAILVAAEDVGRKFLDQQVYKALKSPHYHEILKKLSHLNVGPELKFKKNQIDTKLNADEKKKLNNFLQRMKKLNVIFPSEQRGEYIIRDRLTFIYFRMKSFEFGDK